MLSIRPNQARSKPIKLAGLIFMTLLVIEMMREVMLDSRHTVLAEGKLGLLGMTGLFL